MTEFCMIFQEIYSVMDTFFLFEDLFQRDDGHHRFLELPPILDDGIGRHKVQTKPQLLQPGGDVIGFHHDISFPVIGVRDLIPTLPSNLVSQFEIVLANHDGDFHIELPFLGFRDFFLVLLYLNNI